MPLMHNKLYLKIWQREPTIFRYEFGCPGRYDVLFEDTKGPIRIRISRKNRQRNGQKKKDKKRSTKHTYKTKDRVTRTQLNTGSELRCSGRVSSSCSTSGLKCAFYLTSGEQFDNKIRRDDDVCFELDKHV
jgi:hypothetical protein